MARLRDDEKALRGICVEFRQVEFEDPSRTG